MGKRIVEVDQYLEKLEPGRKEALTTLRELIYEVVPDAVESMEYGMPTYENGGRFCAYASQKNYMSLFMLDTDLVEEYQAKLAHLKPGKSCLRFKELGELPLIVIREMLRRMQS